MLLVVVPKNAKLEKVHVLLISCYNVCYNSSKNYGPIFNIAIRNRRAFHLGVPRKHASLVEVACGSVMVVNIFLFCRARFFMAEVLSCCSPAS